MRFQLRTLQLLPAPEHPSYARATVEVLERLDGQLSVRHEGRIIAAQEAPPGPVFLRNGHQPPTVPAVASIGVNHWDERWTAHLMPLASNQEPEVDQPDFTSGEVAAAPTATVAPASRPSFRRSVGRRSRKPGARACRCGQSNGNWGFTGPPSRNIWRLEVLRNGARAWFQFRRHRIPWRPDQGTFPLNT